MMSASSEQKTAVAQDPKLCRHPDYSNVAGEPDSEFRALMLNIKPREIRIISIQYSGSDLQEDNQTDLLSLLRLRFSPQSFTLKLRKLLHPKRFEECEYVHYTRRDNSRYNISTFHEIEDRKRCADDTFEVTLKPFKYCVTNTTQYYNNLFAYRKEQQLTDYGNGLPGVPGNQCMKTWEHVVCAAHCLSSMSSDALKLMQDCYDLDLDSTTIDIMLLRLEKKGDGPGFVYGLEDDRNESFNKDQNVLKIGRTVDLGKRIGGYKTSTPYINNVRYRIFFECSRYKLAEGFMLLRTISQKIGGEWRRDMTLAQFKSIYHEFQRFVLEAKISNCTIGDLQHCY
jgi:hypothetical protein